MGQLLRRRLLICFVAALGLAAPIFAQNLTWTQATAPTAENLWGVCYGGGQFVAVGENGVILTSPDGAAWTARASGTSAWLNGVTFAQQLYVAVGSNGTILTSGDAVTWTTRHSGGQRLNGVAFGNGHFLAVGEAGTIQISTDGFSWTPTPSPTTGWLRGIAYASGGFLIAGQDGALLATTDGLTFASLAFTGISLEAIAVEDGYTLVAGAPGGMFTSIDRREWTSREVSMQPEAYVRGVAFFNNCLVVVGSNGLIADTESRLAKPLFAAPIGSTAQFNAIAAGLSQAVVVGSGGAIFHAIAEKQGPGFSELISVSPGNNLHVGQSVTLVASATGSGPITYQWRFNDVPIAGATGFVLTLPNVTTEQSGYYSVTASNSVGNGTSSLQLLTIIPVPTSDATDPSFASSLWTIGNFDPQLIIQPDGKILVAGTVPFRATSSHTGLFRLNADGTNDAEFLVGLGLGDGYARIFLQPSGRIVVIGNFGSYNQAGVPPAIRLNSDGTIDPSFRIDPDLLSQSPIFEMLADGRLLALRGSASSGALTVTRLTVDGAIDSSFATGRVLLPVEWTGNVSLAFLDATDASDRLILAISWVTFYDATSSLLVRFRPDGRVDPDFNARVGGQIQTLAAIGNQPAYVSFTTPFEYFTPTVRTIARLNEDGSADPSFQPVVDSSLRRGPTFTAAFAPDGSVITVDRATYSAVIHHASDGITAVQRYDSHGAKVTGSVPRLDGNGVDITQLLFLPSGQLLAAGNFTILNNVFTSHLARLNLSGEIYATRLANLSIRTRAGLDDQTLIAGFVVGGTGGTKPLVARGIGPALRGYGVTDALADPHATIYRGSVPVAENEDWAPALVPDFSAVGAFPLPFDSRDAAIATSLPPGTYSLHVSGASRTTGIALAELYDAAPAPTAAAEPRLVNLSGRAYVAGGDDALIAGFVISGTGIKRLLIRAVGPGLTAYGVGGALSQPILTVFRGSQLVTSNEGPANIDASNAAKAVGAFPLATGSKDAAVVIDLSPGVYSAQVRGKEGDTGVALVEIYEVP